jgi:photosystem II stability/assembly factor-like uncharacterized protein
MPSDFKMNRLFIIWACVMTLAGCEPEEVKIDDPDKSPMLDAQLVLLDHKSWDEYLRDIDFADDQNGLAIGLSATNPTSMFYRTTDGGESWKRETLPSIVQGATGYSFYAIHFENGDAFLSGRGSAGSFFIAKSKDKGYTWSVKTGWISNVPVEFDFYGKYGIGVGNFGIIWTSSDSGETWTESTIPGVENLINVNFIDETHLYASSTASIYFSNDKGKTWTEKLNQGGGSANMEMVSAEAGFSSSSKGIIKTGDGGNSWQELWNTNDYDLINENIMVAGTEHIAFQYAAKKHFHDQQRRREQL